VTPDERSFASYPRTGLSEAGYSQGQWSVPSLAPIPGRAASRPPSPSTSFLPAGRTGQGLAPAMKVSLTAKEYRQLLELVHLGMWAVTAYQGEDTASAKRYFALDQKLLELATEAGCADCVETRTDGTLQPAPELAENERIRELQSEFQNDVFWHELVQRLADRDLSGEQAKRVLETPGVDPAPSSEEMTKKLEERYWAEFEKNDLANVIVLRGGRG